jgi:hypothetical protein
MNADDRLSLDPLDRVEGGNRIVEGSHLRLCPFHLTSVPLHAQGQYSGGSVIQNSAVAPSANQSLMPQTSSPISKSWTSLPIAVMTPENPCPGTAHALSSRFRTSSESAVASCGRTRPVPTLWAVFLMFHRNASQCLPSLIHRFVSSLLDEVNFQRNRRDGLGPIRGWR